MRHSEPKIITPPKAYPLTLDEASEWLHVDPSNDLSENVGVETLIATATDMVEKYCSRALITRTLEVEYAPNPPEILPMRIILPYAAPLQDVNYVKSIEQDGTAHTQSANIYNVDTYAIPGRVQLLMGFWWDYYVFGKYRIQYVCGYGDTSDKIPAPIRTAIQMLVSQIYQSREEMDYAISPQVEVLLQDYKLDSFDYTGSPSVKWSPFGLQSLRY
jgi:uncharacterized phiE125 gp8 family phage protein